MTRFCLDTSTYSQFRRGDPQTLGLVAGAEWIGMPVVVLGELRGGFLLGAQAAQNEAELADFLAISVVEVCPVDVAVSIHYARIYAELRRAGRLIPENDLWIAATASRHSAAVLTYDHHFASVTSVESIILEAPR